MTASVVWRCRTELPPGASSARCAERTRFSASSNHRPLLLRHGRLTSSIVRRSSGTTSPRTGGFWRLNSSRAVSSDASRLSSARTCSAISMWSGHSPIPVLLCGLVLPVEPGRHDTRGGLTIRPIDRSLRLTDDVDERRPPVLGDDGGGAPHGGLDRVGVLHRPLGVPPQAARDGGEVGRRAVYLHPDVRARDVRAAVARDPLLVLPV